MQMTDDYGGVGWRQRQWQAATSTMGLGGGNGEQRSSTMVSNVFFFLIFVLMDHPFLRPLPSHKLQGRGFFLSFIIFIVYYLFYYVYKVSLD